MKTPRRLSLFRGVFLCCRSVLHAPQRTSFLRSKTSFAQQHHLFCLTGMRHGRVLGEHRLECQRGGHAGHHDQQDHGGKVFTQWSVTPFGFGRNFAGFEKRLCAYSKKSLWCGRSSGRVVPPLAAGRSPTDDFLSS